MHSLKIRSGLLLAGICCVNALFAQPSDEEVRKRSMQAGAMETRFTSEKGTVHTTLTEKWYMRTVESKWETNYPEIKRWERNEYRYDYKGGAWVYTRTYQNSSWYDGIPNPSEAEIVALLEKSQVGYQGAVLQKPVFRLAADPKWNWHTFNRVECMVEVELYEKVNYTNVARKKIIFPINLYRDTGGGVHDGNSTVYFKNAPWLPIYMPVISSSYGSETILDTKEYTNEEAEQIRTAQEMEAEVQEGNRLDALGSLDIPDFKSDKEAIAWIHQILLEGDKQKIELLLRKRLSAYYFEQGSSVRLNEAGNTLLSNTLMAAAHYKDLFCAQPTVKHAQDNMIQFYDRELQSHARIAVEQVDGLFRIRDIDCVAEPNSDKLAACQMAGESNCGEAIDVSPENPVARFAIGDRVRVNWNGQGAQFFNGKVLKLDPHDENRYFVEFDEIQSAWIPAEYMAPR